jgi:hypothetical protein
MGLVQRSEGAFMNTVSSDKREAPRPDAFMREYKESTQAPPPPHVGPSGLRTRLWYRKGLAVARTVLWVNGRYGRIWLNNITSLVRGRGYGTEVLTRLTALADKYGAIICVKMKAADDSPLNLAELTMWCRRHGFKVDRNGGFVYRGRRKE